MKRSVFVLAVLTLACNRASPPPEMEWDPIAKPATLDERCESLAKQQVLEAAPGVFVATGYDLANVVLIRTATGGIVVDTAMSPERAGVIRAALAEHLEGPIHAVIYTHSHIDHVGGASVFAGADTPIWATASFRDSFLRQYSLFQPSQLRRGDRQFGSHVPAELLACSAIGRRPDIAAAIETGARMPTHTFAAASKALTIDGLEIELVAAPGETTDQLFVWIPSRRVLVAGDNIFSTFPNLYTIRGTRPRPVDDWIRTLDAMRTKKPDVLVPAHTEPITGAGEVSRALVDYRDAIQWVRDETVRRANRGQSPDTLASRVGLPPHLAQNPRLAELYGQVDWGARAIYANELGWFDGDANDLYPLPAVELAIREIDAMGGAEEVRVRAAAARQSGELRWASHLLTRLRESGQATEVDRDLLAQVWQGLAEETANTNGRAYLLESAYELTHGPQPKPSAVPDDALLREIPLELIFRQLAVRLNPEKASGVHESVTFVFADEGTTIHVTVRRGIAEIAVGDPLPGMPPPVATVKASAMSWRHLAVGKVSRLEAIRSGALDVDNVLAFRSFMARFDTD